MELALIIVALIFGAAIGTVGASLVFKLIAIIMPWLLLVFVIFSAVFGIAIAVRNTLRVFFNIQDYAKTYNK